MRIDPSLWSMIQDEVRQGYVSVRTHPSGLAIYNYTPKCQYEWRWNEATTMCRGLIIGPGREVVSRPFRKFFNLDEHLRMGLSIPDEPFKVYDKADGSLCISFFLSGTPLLATRGSFDSDMADHANMLMVNKYCHLWKKMDPSKTYLFEVIYPENRIVVDYGDTDDLFLLAIIDTETGKDLPLEDIGFSLVKQHDGMDMDTVLSIQEKNREGFVLHFESGLRLKVKFEEYRTLHKLYTTTSEKRIWELLSAGAEPVAEGAPEKFINWATGMADRLKSNFLDVERKCRDILDTTDLSTSRKELAGFILSNHKELSPVLFSMLDSKPYNHIIWKLVKPVSSKPFLEEASASGS